MGGCLRGRNNASVKKGRQIKYSKHVRNAYLDGAYEGGKLQLEKNWAMSQKKRVAV